MAMTWEEKQVRDQTRRRYRLYYWRYGQAKKLEVENKKGYDQHLVFPDLQSAEFEAQKMADKIHYEVLVVDYGVIDYDNNIYPREKVVSVFKPKTEDDDDD